VAEDSFESAVAGKHGMNSNGMKRQLAIYRGGYTNFRELSPAALEHEGA
jgi:hypothetical protein